MKDSLLHFVSAAQLLCSDITFQTSQVFLSVSAPPKLVFQRKISWAFCCVGSCEIKGISKTMHNILPLSSDEDGDILLSNDESH